MKSQRKSSVRKISDKVRRNGKKHLQSIESYFDGFMKSQCNYELYSLEYEESHCLPLISN
ncbi:hypothetical protein R9C00_13600 [Flammeovirgaceae bacterium SG7u.111]|nr:hypothetical protein [Flammeovirgaceae bacterium SG7u.132]WPO38493.1 hypothetical protein R9C00_13600 [Flammeovirgaceae bacterium SG7u.111]